MYKYISVKYQEQYASREKGVTQGIVTSSILFNVYIEKLVERMR
jgi:hypothetical protein